MECSPFCGVRIATVIRHGVLESLPLEVAVGGRILLLARKVEC